MASKVEEYKEYDYIVKDVGGKIVIKCVQTGVFVSEEELKDLLD